MIASCGACGWRGIPTISPKRGAFKGYDPITGPVWEGRGQESDRCPACNAKALQPVQRSVS